MTSVLLLREHIESLRPGMPASELETIKLEMLSVIERANAGEELHLKLSRREREVMTMMLEGQRLKEIAARLDISVKTVTTHRARLMRKLQVEDNLGLYRYGIRNGLIGV
ncbi:MAG TPA: LuxR C-terminal-related transcriptional regulator [Thermoanaerobaculia bacterium]|nr:LuxR C-terminal-related transcriptional regulator [Thermoanaerobaculia bacterium]